MTLFAVMLVVTIASAAAGHALGRAHARAARTRLRAPLAWLDDAQKAYDAQQDPRG